MRADHDLRSARALASLADPLLDTAIYHCQQAAEKSVKAWLQGQDAPFPKTHDAADLVNKGGPLVTPPGGKDAIEREPRARAVEE